MKKNLKTIITIFLMLIFISIYTYSFADVGSFDRYDSGSSWDAGSSWDSDWGSSSSSWDWDDDDHYSYSSSSDGDLGFLLGLLLGSDGGGIVFAIIIIFIVIYSKKHKGTVHRPRNAYIPNRVNTDNVTKDRSIQVERQIKIVDQLFSEEKFISFTKELFVKLQNAWTARDWEPMRLFETPELFEQHKAQVQGYIETNRINVMDRIAVNYAYLYTFKQTEEKEILEVALKSTMKDYIIDATTKELIEGSKTQDRQTLYKLTFERTKGILTEEKTDEVKTTNCPNCGAPTQITSAGKCEYCDSIILTGNHGWVLSNLEPFRN